MITKEYFLDRLNAGDDIDTIGQEIANMMNEALEEKRAALEEAKAAAAKAENEAAKRDIIEEMIELVQEYAILEGMDENEIKVSPEDVDAMVAAFTEMFAAMRQLKTLSARLNEKKPLNKSDDDILNEFVKIFS